jgi:hypothetical protein
MDQPLIIFAGNYRQAEDYARESASAATASSSGRPSRFGFADGAATRP